MKFTTKSASVLLAILATSTIAGTAVSAEENAKNLDSKARLEVKGDKDTGGPDTDGKIPDVETGEMVTPTNPDETDYNGQKGPIKVESVSNLRFGTKGEDDEITTQAKDIVRTAAAIDVKDSEGKDTVRGAMISFADVRSDKFGYTVQAKMTQQFMKEGTTDVFLDGSTLDYSNGIARREKGNDNVAGTVKTPAFQLSFDKVKNEGNAVEVFNADKDAKQGKGRYALEFGQSDDFVQDNATMIGTGTPKTAAESVKLTIPNKTASNMSKGNYEAKITWSIVEAQ